ncbi:MAG: hypothetical protein HeimC3_24750 [Candidatus Heimdallarchaeota archaeon LC_3]|nr:MAG: hypothetical protein HeimC3_24750 [Candidatus Heimdallarchaeota archaeon LC_3]
MSQELGIDIIARQLPSDFKKLLTDAFVKSNHVQIPNHKFFHNLGYDQITVQEIILKLDPRIKKVRAGSDSFNYIISSKIISQELANCIVKIMTNNVKYFKIMRPKENKTNFFLRE